MFAECMFRSGTIPSIVRSDRGPELMNAIMSEYTACLGIARRYGTPWRPMEQGKVERVHQETQKILGLMVQDVMRCDPSEWSECLCVVEFVLYNTPGPHGYTPRDIDRQWSLAVPLSKDLQAFEFLEFEPVEEYTKVLFRAYKHIRAVVVGRMAESSAKRAQLANRYRKAKSFQPGDRVLYRDPRSRAAGGRTPWKEPLSSPWTVASVSKSGHRLTLVRADGSKIDDAHAEDVVLLPENAKDLESRDEVQFEPDERDAVEDISKRRSVGEMLEAAPPPPLPLLPPRHRHRPHRHHLHEGRLRHSYAPRCHQTWPRPPLPQ